jgi:hypothetical protein
MIEVSLVYVATSELVLETSHGTAFSNRTVLISVVSFGLIGC